MSNQQSKIDYEFAPILGSDANHRLIIFSVNVAVPAQKMEASDNKEYLGCPILGGSGKYERPDGSQHSFEIVPHTVSPNNIIWAANPDGTDGISCVGLDSTGISIGGDNGYLQWSGGKFWFNTGDMNTAVGLVQTNWPPRSN